MSLFFERTWPHPHQLESRPAGTWPVARNSQGQWREAEVAFTRLVKVTKPPWAPSMPGRRGAEQPGWEVLSDGLREHARAETAVRCAGPHPPDGPGPRDFRRAGTLEPGQLSARPAASDSRRTRLRPEALAIMEGLDHPQLPDLLRATTRVLFCPAPPVARPRAAALEARLDSTRQCAVPFP